MCFFTSCHWHEAKEWLSVKIYGINPSDKDGDNLEVLGTPYPYIPMTVRVPNSY
jgi:hypothetical protein